MFHSKTKSSPTTVVVASESPGETASRLLQKILKTVDRSLNSATAHWRADNEHVHRLRVSVRRALAAIYFFKELIPESCEKWFRKKLKNVLHATRTARELDVLIEEQLSRGPKLKRNPLKKWRSEREHAQRAIDVVTRKMHRKHVFRKQIRHLVSDLSFNLAHKTSNVPISGRQWCLTRFRVIGNRFLELKSADLDVKTLHRLRIQIKQLRYAAEIVDQVMETFNLVELTTALTAIQQQLGVLQDHVTARKQLQRLVKSESKRSDKKDLGNLIANEDQVIAECVDRFRASADFGDGGTIHQCLENIFQTLTVASETQ